MVERVIFLIGIYCYLRGEGSFFFLCRRDYFFFKDRVCVGRFVIVLFKELVVCCEGFGF